MLAFERITRSSSSFPYEGKCTTLSKQMHLQNKVILFFLVFFVFKGGPLLLVIAFARALKNCCSVWTLLLSIASTFEALARLDCCSGRGCKSLWLAFVLALETPQQSLLPNRQASACCLVDVFCFFVLFWVCWFICMLPVELCGVVYVLGAI